jgi:hypothetical protein
MKTIIETSFEFSGVSPNARTAFDPNNMKRPHYYDLSKKAGRSLFVWWDYEEDGVKKSSRMIMQVPAGLDEQGVKNFIMSEINK